MDLRTRVLVVEDEAALRDGIVDLLTFQGMSPVGVERGDTGLQRALGESFDLVVLDVMLPGMDGFEVCRKLRAARPAQPILLLTARGRESDVLTGFEAGCDDYVTKPFSLAVLLARVQALVRRGGTTPRSLELGPVTIDVANLRAEGDQTIDLSPRDVELLAYLAENQGRVVSRDELLQNVWGFAHVDGVETRAIDMHVVKLRRKLDAARAGFNPIETVRGAGYRLAT